MASGRHARFLERFSFGGRLPGGLGLVLALTIVTSLVVAFGSRHTVSLFELARLSPDRVLAGEVWRLVTWGIIEPSPLRLLFTSLILYWFGRELALEWGSGRFLGVYAGLTLASSVGTVLVSLVDADARHASFIGGWPLAAALIVAWGLYFPDRVIRIWFVLPVKAVVVAWATVALTVAFAIYAGWESYLPSLFAEGTMLAWLFRHSLSARWRRARRAHHAARRDAAARQRASKRRSSEEVLRALEAKDDELAPLPPEIQGMLGPKDGGRE